MNKDYLIAKYTDKDGDIILIRNVDADMFAVNIGCPHKDEEAMTISTVHIPVTELYKLLHQLSEERNAE